MADDELDPAFLDIDLPAHSSTSPLSSLAAGFAGSSLDIDQYENDSFEAQLGAGFGAVLADELEELRCSPGSLGGLVDLDEDGSRRVHLAWREGDDGASSSDDAVPSRTRTQSKRTGARKPTERHLQSLASELASVTRPERRERTLLRELGLDDDAGRDATEPSDLSEGDSDGSLARLTSANVPRRPSRRADGFARSYVRDRVAASPRRRPAKNGATEMPASLEDEIATPTMSDCRREAGDDAKRESTVELEAIAAELTASTGASETFMGRLRTHVGASPEHTDRTSEPDISTTATAATMPHSSLDYRDRQGIIEDLCSNFLRTLQSSISQRTEQQPGLAVLEREIARTDGGWQHALARLDPLPQDLFEAETPPHRDGDDHVGATATAEHGDRDCAASSPQGQSVDLSILAGARVTSELALLRSTTDSLLSILASLAEQTQEQSALASDTGRKLRAFRTQLGTLRDEIVGVERSEAFVEAYEARQSSRGDTAGARARREVHEVQQRLDSGWIQAQAILTGCA